MSMFPIYVIDKIDLKDIRERETILRDGRTHIRNCILAHDFEVVQEPTRFRVYIRSPWTKELYENFIDKGGLSLFMQYRNELFWILDLKKEDISTEKTEEGNFIVLIIPASRMIAGVIG